MSIFYITYIIVDSILNRKNSLIAKWHKLVNNQYREKEIVDLWLFDTKIMLRSVWQKIAKKGG